MSKEHKIKVEGIKDKKVLKDVLNELNKGKNAKRNVLIFKIGISTGLRISDIIDIKIEDVRGKTEFELTEQKTSKKRKVYLHNVLTELTEYLNILDNEAIWLFPNYWDKTVHLTSNQYYKLLQKVAKELDLDYLGTHTMRKTFGYWFYKEYKDVATLMTIFNHSSPSITLRYIGITDEEIRNSLKNFSII